MNATDSVVDQAIAKLDAEDAGTDTSKASEDKSDDKTKADDTAAKPTKSDKGSESSHDTAKPAGKSDDKSGKDADKRSGDTAEPAKTDDKDSTDEKDKDGKFTADDALEVDDKPKGEPQTPTDNAGIQLSQDEQKYVAEHIGEPLVLKGYKEVDGKLQATEVKAYSWSDVPKDFKFGSDSEFGAAGDGFRRLEDKAGQILGQFRQNQSDASAQNFEKRENEGIRSDLSELQNEGRFPKFTVQPGAKGFDDTPEAKQVADVLGIMQERNQAYLDQYNQGRPYKHIGFAEAFDIWERQNPQKQAEKQKADDQKKEDAERKQTATTSERMRGTDASNIVKPTVRAGTTTRDILARIDAEM